MSFLKDKTGGVASIFLLILLPFFITLMIALPDLAYFHSGANTCLKNVVIHSVRTAASAVDKHSQAAGTPMIDPERAQIFFEKGLQDMLGLDENLKPTEHSKVEDQISYFLVVFNGPNEHVIPGKCFVFNGETLETEDINFTEQQQTFFIREEQINLESGDIEVKLDRPGAIATVTINLKPIYRNREKATRWAAAKIENGWGGNLD